MNKNVSNFPGGLNKDNSNIDRPKGSYSFALNAVNETHDGNMFFLSNEESNQACGSLPQGYVPLGSVYVSDNKTVVLSTKEDETLSEIGIVDQDCNYVTLANLDLGFKLSNPVDLTYRLRQGCETTIYWVDGRNNKPMYYIVEKPEKFQNKDGSWDKNKFELQRSYTSIPVFQEVEVLNSGGQLRPGSYNMAIQYLDENLNPTEWVTTSEVVKVFNDDTNESFLEIRGSVKIVDPDEVYRDFPITDKAIKVEMQDLDKDFLFYRLAFIEASQGTGLINDVYFTATIATETNIFIFTGNNYEQKGTLEEIQAFSNIIESAGSIEQIDNMLLLGNTQGKQTPLCNLQSYASRITADMTTKKVLNNRMLDKANPKSPTASFEGVGYMPGEIYSFGIVYVFVDGTTTPVFHIPGKGSNIINTSGTNVSDDFVFSPAEEGSEQKVFPMSTDNESESTRYTDNSNCGPGSAYWGVDFTGEPLKNKKVRHHRFPKRSDVGLPLVSVESEVGGESEYYQVQLEITGNLKTPCSQEQIDEGDCSELTEANSFQARVTYQVDGVVDTLTVNILPSDYPGTTNTQEIDINERSNFIVSPNIEIISIEESQDDGSKFPVGVDSGQGTSEHASPGLNYSATVEKAVFTSEERIYSSEIFGIKFSNIDIPSPDDTGGEEIIGYYIVRNERTEEEKTILDSAVMTPAITNDKYIAQGLLFPEFGSTEPRYSRNIYGLIHPENKFKDKKYPEFTNITEEGAFSASQTLRSKSRYRDVQDGTSYDSSVHKSGGGKDRDGWSLKAILRDTIVNYSSISGGFNLLQEKVQNVFYLNALQSRDVQPPGQDESAQPLTVYNVAGDNRVGVIEFKDNEEEVDVINKLPYVYLNRKVADSYSNFRSLPYYKTSVNFRKFYNGAGEVIEENKTSVEFNGDTYITPLRYLNTMWWDNRLAKRAGKTSVWNYIIGGILAVVGTILAFFTAGASLVVVGAGIALIGGAALFISSGIKRDALVRAYYDEYEKGLRETVLDDWVKFEYQDIPCKGYNRSSARCQRYGDYGRVGCCDTPEDDELQWITDAVTDLWFESQVNMSLRYGMTTGVPDFLDAPGKVESGNVEPEGAYEHFDIYKQRDKTIFPFTKLDRHVMNKLSVFDPDRGEKSDSRSYIGHPLGEYYGYNLDYERVNKEKTFFHLPLEYDCCSDCQEDFPTRVAYSMQAFQEELTDNFRVFLPNNYTDIEGETGAITDLFRIKNNIYIHTEEGLWQQPQNFQERVTGDIVSFLGTGSYFSVPPRKILDDNKASGGTRHRTATLKTKNGVFFVSENENKIYQFDGNSLQPISDLGMSTWFKENLKLKLLEDYYRANQKPYPYDDNPSNPFGVGFTSVYDTIKERVIFSKKDAILSDNITGSDDFEVCSVNGELIKFDNFQQTISEYESNGWEYLGLENCRMKFQKTGYKPEIVVGQTTEVIDIPLDTIIVPILDDTSMIDNVQANIISTLNAWFPTFKNSINGGNNSITMREPFPFYNENWIRDYPLLALDIVGQDNKNVLLLSFVDEADGSGQSANFHGGFTSDLSGQPRQTYIDSVNQFVNEIYPRFETFIAISYPIVRQGNGDCYEYLQHNAAAIEARDLSFDEAEALTPNPFLLASGDWETVKSNLRNNPYKGMPKLREYGWGYKINRVSQFGGNAGGAGCPADPDFIIPPCAFTEDVTEVLASIQQSETVLTEEEVEILVPETQITYVDGSPTELAKANNSWTLSFSLKIKKWISWHSYLVGFYYYIANAFYSWRYWGQASKGKNSFWRHNVKNNYQTFFGERHPFIVEYVAMSENLKTKIWDDITLHTESKVYDEDKKNYYDKRGVTFNKAVFYNTRQCTGTLELKPKEESLTEDYMMEQVVNVTPGTIIIDRNERDWNLNDIRDIRIDYEQPIFDKNILSLQDEYYTDKVVNTDSLDINKNWEQLESFRDKYLGIRLIFDKFEDVKLILNYSIETENESFR